MLKKNSKYIFHRDRAMKYVIYQVQQNNSVPYKYQKFIVSGFLIIVYMGFEYEIKTEWNYLGVPYCSLSYKFNHVKILGITYIYVYEST